MYVTILDLHLPYHHFLDRAHALHVLQMRRHQLGHIADFRVRQLLEQLKMSNRKAIDVIYLKAMEASTDCN
jgi:hypothetical protein